MIRRRYQAVSGAVLLVVLLVGGGWSVAAVASTPSVSIVPGPTGGKFANNQVVRASVGANSLFVPHSRVVIIECADPGGDAAHLPTSLATCDENTVQADTTVVQSDGSFVEPNYTLYSLPSAIFGENAKNEPVCSVSSECVLFVGEDQNDFTKPKVFSSPFLMVGGGPAPTATATTATTMASPAVDPSVTLSASQLAFTGPSNWILPLAGIGVLLLLLSVTGVALAGRSRS